MNPYDQLHHEFERLARTRHRICTGGVTPLGDLVELIRDEHIGRQRSDDLLRALVNEGRTNPDALTVALHALVPMLRTRLARAVTDEYRVDALANLAIVMLESDLATPHLARRLVNRAHNRTWRAAGRVRTSGRTRIMTNVPCDPADFETMHARPDDRPTIDAAIERADLARFGEAVAEAIAGGDLAAHHWTTFRDLRLVRPLLPEPEPTTGRDRVAACRAARRLAPIAQRHLGVHAA